MTRLADRAHSTVSPSKSTRKKLKISVLYGGPSSEREVSLKSGTAVALALESLGHDVERVDLHPDNLGPLDRPMDMPSGAPQPAGRGGGGGDAIRGTIALDQYMALGGGGPQVGSPLGAPKIGRAHV